MPLTVASIGQQMLTSRTLLERRPVQMAMGVLAATTVLSIALAPETDATGWDWVRLLAIAALGAMAVLVFATTSAARAEDRQEGLVGTATLVLIGLILNLTFSLGTALVFSIGISIATLVAVTGNDERSAWAMTGTLLVAVPSWTWSALEAWDWGLLLLVPLAAIGIISDGHMRAAAALPATVTSPLTSRGHRLGSWLGVLGGSLLMLCTALVTDADNGAAVVGAVGATILVGLGLTAPSATADARRAIMVVDVALLWIALCWIVSL
jgi:hypothetical protein